jgi:hypothetical protein
MLIESLITSSILQNKFFKTYKRQHFIAINNPLQAEFLQISFMLLLGSNNRNCGQACDIAGYESSLPQSQCSNQYVTTNCRAQRIFWKDWIVEGIMKFEDGNLMIWWCMDWDGIGHAINIDGRIDEYCYLIILEDQFQ